MPLKLLDLDRIDAPEAYRHKLVLVRSDQHVAWRGDTVSGPDAIVDTVRGAA